MARVTGAVKRYQGVVALNGVDFEIGAGEVRALLGKNGAGKSTLIRLLTGAETPDAGSVAICGEKLDGEGDNRTGQADRLGVRAVYQELSLITEMTIAENMFLGKWPRWRGALDFALMRRRSSEALHLLGLDIDPDRTIGSLSVAERQLVEIARATMGQPRLVILDEPTSSLAAAEVDLVFDAVRRLSAAGIAVIYVSHRMNEIREIAAFATIMRDGQIASQVAVRDADTVDIVRMMLGHDEQSDQLVDQRDHGPVTLSVRDLAVFPKIESVSFDLHQGEVLGIAGLLGSGRTELLHAIMGLTPIRSGTVTVDGVTVGGQGYPAMLARGFGLTPESRKDDGIIPYLGVDENTVATDFDRVSSAGVLSWVKIASATRDIVARMNVKAARTSTPIATLSGGNQQKIVIGRWVYAGSRVLLLDEPTRGVDVEAKSQIYAIIRKLSAEGCSIVFISSEIEELPKVCDRVLVLRDGRIAKSFAAPDIDADRLLAASIAGAS